MTRVAHEPLRLFVSKVYGKAGVPAADADVIADSLVQADLWGHQSHGVLRTGWYLARLQSGAMRARTEPRFAVDGGAIAVIDGADGIGQVIAKRAAQEAIRRAKAHGIAAVAVRDSNHFGTCMYWTRMAAEAGCVGMLYTNGGPAIAPWGGIRKIIGTNPWSVAAPAGKRPPLMVDMLAGVLSGSAFLSSVNGPYKADLKSGAGHFFMAVDIAALQPLAEFNARMEEFIGEIKATPRARGVDEIFYPGEMEAASDARLRREGIELPEDTIADLRRISAESGEPAPF